MHVEVDAIAEAHDEQKVDMVEQIDHGRLEEEADSLVHWASEKLRRVELGAHHSLSEQRAGVMGHRLQQMQILTEEREKRRRES